jgi:hypothetical protein
MKIAFQFFIFRLKLKRNEYQQIKNLDSSKAMTFGLPCELG